MARTVKYDCSKCGRSVGKLNLKAKRVQFQELGRGGAVVASRVVAWLCIVPHPDGAPSCLDADPDYHRPVYAAAPGMAGTILEKEVFGED